MSACCPHCRVLYIILWKNCLAWDMMDKSMFLHCFLICWTLL
jgi:hypothetical protein